MNRRPNLRPVEQKHSCWLAVLTSVLCLCSARAEDSHSGPLFNESDLVLFPGRRIDAAGPFYHNEMKETTHSWAFCPFFSFTEDPEVQTKEFDFLYPLLTYDRFGEQYRFQFFQLLSWAGGPTQVDPTRHRTTIFPVYFHQRSTIPADNYTAVVPFYGRIKNHLFKEEIFIVMFPGYSQSRRNDVVTDNYMYPFFHLRHGNSLNGWQFWPLVGHEVKGVTTRTNLAGDAETVGGHKRWFAMWPFYAKQQNAIGTDNPEQRLSVFPAYIKQRSTKRDLTTVLWPFFTVIDDREKKYHEWEGPYPFIVMAHGEGKQTTRYWPIYSHAQNTNSQSGFWMWPFYKYNKVKSDPLDRVRIRIMFYLFSDSLEKNMATDNYKRRSDFWPLFTHRHELNGTTRLQILAPAEPFVPTNKSIERDYAPLWSLWVSEGNPKTGASSQSLLWNLYRHEIAPDKTRKCSVFFGLFQTQSTPGKKPLRLFYIPLGKPNP